MLYHTGMTDDTGNPKAVGNTYSLFSVAGYGFSLSCGPNRVAFILVLVSDDGYRPNSRLIIITKSLTLKQSGMFLCVMTIP